jgi:hypothetical protein
MCVVEQFGVTEVSENPTFEELQLRCLMSQPLQFHRDLQALIDSLLSFARSMVSENGSFNPFGATMYADGVIQWVAADTGEEFPSSQVLIESLTETFKGMAASGDIRAATICYDALTVPPGETVKADVIGFALEHRSGDCITALIPYVRRENKDVECRELFTVERSPQFF